MNNNFLRKKYPKVNYIGNKEKLSEWIVEHLPVNEGKILDLFAGGCSISYELKKYGFQVLSNDVLYSSFVISKSIIENNSVTLDEKHVHNALKEEINLTTRENLTWLENRLFFDYEVDELAKIVEYSKRLEGYEHTLYLSLLRRALIRKLPYSRMNVPWKNIVKLRDEEYSYEKYGRRRAYHNRTFSFHMLDNLESYNNAVFDNKQFNKSFQLDVFDMIEKIDSVDIIYLDPPYPGTMNKYNEFYDSFDFIFDEKKRSTDLTNKDNFLDLLNDIIIKSINKTNYYVLSINSRANPGINEIKSLFKKYGKVKVVSRKHNYQVSGKANKNQNLEKLVILEV